jgi:hypothetical protein
MTTALLVTSLPQRRCADGALRRFELATRAGWFVIYELYRATWYERTDGARVRRAPHSRWTLARRP